MRRVVINVTDLDLGVRFWSEVTGLEVVGLEEGWHGWGWLAYLGTKNPTKYEITLQDASASPVASTYPNHLHTNPVHVDITPSDGVDWAVRRVLELGGVLKKPPSLYPRPGSHGGEPPALDWAVMQDPFGNEFCLVVELSEEQSRAAMAAEATTDQEWREAAGVTTRPIV